jgi:hypothetical protein
MATGTRAANLPPFACFVCAAKRRQGDTWPVSPCTHFQLRSGPRSPVARQGVKFLLLAFFPLCSEKLIVLVFIAVRISMPSNLADMR